MNPLLAFWTAFVLVAFAEVGDKTQVSAIVLASRYRRLPVLFGLMASLSILSLIAVLGGTAIFEIVPAFYVRCAAAFAFVLFALWTFIELWRHEEEERDRISGRRRLKGSMQIFSYVFFVIFIAEFGDKTQLATIVLSSSLSEPFFIFLGAVAAFFVVDAPCIYIGKKIAERVNVKYIKIASAVTFLVMGIFFLLELL